MVSRRQPATGSSILMQTNQSIKNYTKKFTRSSSQNSPNIKDIKFLERIRYLANGSSMRGGIRIIKHGCLDGVGVHLQKNMCMSIFKSPEKQGHCPDILFIIVFGLFLNLLKNMICIAQTRQKIL